MPNIGPLELLLVLVVALLVLGPKKLPAAGRSLGEGIRGFRDSLAGRPEEPSRDLVDVDVDGGGVADGGRDAEHVVEPAVR
jgi:sec-independent protein translocase protein TatA